MSEAVTGKEVGLEVVPVACRIGAEVRGVRLSPDLDRNTVNAIWKTLLKHKVIFFQRPAASQQRQPGRFCRAVWGTVCPPDATGEAGSRHYLRT